MPDWERHYAQARMPREPAQVLREFAHLLPRRGRALDLACGLGANARFLASRGLETSAWDRSPQAISRLREASAREGLALAAEVRDVVTHPPAPDGWDVIVVSRFLERALAPALCAALRAGGLLYYQTFVLAAAHPEQGPRQARYRLGDNELLRLFAPLRLIVYREEGRVGDLRAGLRDQAYAVFQRRE